MFAELDPLPAVVGIDAALATDAPRLFDTRSNVVDEQVLGSDEVPSPARSAIHLALTVPHGRLAPASIEPRGIVITPERHGRFTVWCSHQAPHRLRDQLAGAFDLDPDRIRVVIPSVGGAFGGKSATFPEYLVAFRLASDTGRSVRWIERRGESLTAATHGRGQRHRLDLGADETGRLEVLDVSIDLDVGAYPHTGALVALGSAWMMSGPYRIPNLRIRTRTVVTNAPPIAPYRGAGRPEAALSLERAMDALARAIGRDPAEVRAMNFIPPEAFPYETPTGARYDSGRYEHTMRAALDRSRYGALRKEQSRRRASGDRALGIGIGCYVERSGGQPGSAEFGAVEVRPNGIVASTGSSSQGQGHRTAMAQVVAAVFDVAPSAVEVVQGDTDAVPEGTGTFASRSIQIGGSALHEASLEAREAARRLAADRLEVDADDLEYRAGGFAAAGVPERSVTIFDLADEGNEIRATHRFRSPQAFPYGTHVAAVEIDRETGVVRLRSLVAVDDCGTIVNPHLVEGQALGSIVQGIGQALFEGIVIDESGQHLTSSFLTYTMPSAADLSFLDVSSTETPNPNSPIGAKGAGESGCIGAPAAIVNAVLDAIDDDHVDAIDMPITPERVWDAIHGRPGT